MLDRRQFLSAAAAVGALILTPRAAIHSEGARDPRERIHPELLLALGPVAVREIGDAYRALVPAESDQSALETALRAELGAHSSTEDPVRADFAAGRMIVVRDWLLSVTEARQCALFSLRSA